MPYVPGRSGSSGGGGIEETTLTLTAPSSDYSHTVGATLSGGVLDGWRVQNHALVDSIEESAAGYIAITWTSTPRQRWGWDDEPNYQAPALLPPDDVMGPIDIHVSIQAAASMASSFANVGVGCWTGDTDNQTGYVGVYLGLWQAANGHRIWRSLGNSQAVGYDPGTSHPWTTQQWLRMAVVGKEVSAYADDGAAPVSWSQLSTAKEWDRAGGARCAGITLGGENATQETIRILAFEMTYYPAP